MAAKRRSGLGRGLNALLGEIPTETPEKLKMQSIPVEWLQRGKYQPRKDIDPYKLQELADSIKAQGIIQPIVVRSIATDSYEIIAGERRWRAGQLAGLTEVPVIIQSISDRAAIAISLIENIQREDLNPMEESEALRRLVDEFELTHQQVADAIGRSRAAISNALRLLDLEPQVKIMLANGDLDMGHARAILILEADRQIAVAKKIVELGLTVRMAEKLAKEAGTEKQLAEVTKINADTAKLQNDLSQRLGTKVTIKHKANGKGSLVINYSSLEELDGVLERIN